MKPFRIRLAHNLIGGYGMLDKLQCFSPPKLPRADMLKFHTPEYLDFLSEVQPEHQQALTQFMTAQARQRNFGLPAEPPSDSMKALLSSFNRFGVDGDCPIFRGLYDYCELYSGGSVAGAWKLNRGTADIAINWSGGLHHAKKNECSGFCYTNDIVLAILELLRYHPRVLYIDIDVHHGDGVEEAFYLTDRVMTVSFHRHGDGFFPNTGALSDTGEGKGRNHSLNFPLKDGIDDASYREIFKTVIGSVMASYKPGAIVLQCGADSLAGDKLGPFNLTLRGHGFAVEFCKSFAVPLLLLGGGGYTIENVARCWTYETAIALGQATHLDEYLPYNKFIEHWTPDYKLHLQPDEERPNMNDPAELHRIQCVLLQQLKELGGPPSVAYDTTTNRASDALHAFHEESARAKAEDAAMDSAVEGGSAKGEFFRNNKDQDATTMGIVRPKPAGSIQTHNNTSSNSNGTKPAAAAAVKTEAAPMEH